MVKISSRSKLMLEALGGSTKVEQNNCAFSELYDLTSPNECTETRVKKELELICNTHS